MQLHSRAPESYVEATLRGLFETIGPKEKGLLRAVVQIGDLDQGVSARRALEVRRGQMFRSQCSPSTTFVLFMQLASGFQAEIAQGLLEIVRVPPVEDYPALDALPQLHNDTEERTRWRSKQV
jgi:hypothetical protein